MKDPDFLSKNIPAQVLETSGQELEILIRPAPSSILSAVCGEHWLAVGDAAYRYDPITSAGITKVLMQKKQAGIAIASLITEQEAEAIKSYTHWNWRCR